MRIREIGLFVLMLAPVWAPPAAAGPFGAWAAVVVAGDDRGDAGEQAEVFDNARRDIARRLVQIGFEPGNVRQFSAQPGRYIEPTLRSEFQVLRSAMDEITRIARGGCFVYFTSHGTPQGVGLGNQLLAPEGMAAFLADACPDRLTVVIVSACYSGVFVPALAAPNRMVLTAARHDRNSFGCSNDFTYTYFDQCILESFPASRTFPDLAVNARACVAAREEAEGVEVPSEPQLFIGDRAAPLLELYSLAPG